MIQHKQLSLTLFLLLLLIPLHISAEQVCKFKYKGTPEELHNSKLKVSEKTVAMSEHIRVSSPIDSISKGTNSSVYFLIDQSPSMMGTSTFEPNDQWGSRYTVTSALIDTIYKVNPNTEIGLCFFAGNLYMDNFDDPQIMNQIDIVDSRKGSYMSLLQLNKEYESKAIGNATGYEILKHYLRVENIDSTFFNPRDHVDLIYKPTSKEIQGNGGTNISVAFDAVKKGFESAKYDVDQRFVIFFSDGEATYPKDDTLTMMKYIDGTDVPTTFTVYFTKDNTALENLEIMTENIKTNGYSETNSKTQLHTIETNHEKLMKLLMDNAIGTILSQVNTNIPIKIDVGSTSKSNWDGEGFSFGKLFPLTGVTTDFQFKIEYQLKKDTIQYVRTEYDTVTSDVNFTVEIVHGYQMPDTLEAMYWDRSISFYQNGTEINTIDPTLGDVEIRFTSTKIDTHYTYNDVKIELTTENGDRELFSLENKGSYHAFTFSNAISAATENDGVVQFSNPDEVTALFKNSELPLDTLLVKIPVDGKDEFTITGGAYFDNSADGHVDSIFLAVSPEKRIETALDEIVNALTLPGFRSFKINSKRVTSGGIALSVSEERAEITTYIVDGEDILTVSETSLSPTAALLESSFTFDDSVAPVVVNASLVDSVKAGSLDLLTVELSEEPREVTENNPFKLYKMPGDTPYDAKLSLENSNGRTVTFRVEEVNGESAISHGDSLRINWETKGVRDGANNVQDNSNNARCLISVQKIEEGIIMQEAAYFDRDADGKIDEIAISFGGEYIEENIDELADAVSLPEFRNFEKLSHRYENSGILLKVKQNISTEDINTAVTGEDRIEIKQEFTTANSMVVLPRSVTATDRAAPVIMEAHFVDSVFQGIQGGKMHIAEQGMDILMLAFSENILDVSSNKPFNFYSKKSDSEYEVELKFIRKSSDRIYEFQVLHVENGKSIESVDSIWIRNDIGDSEENYQNNSSNIKREIPVETVIEKSWKPDEVELVLKTTVLDPEKEYYFDKSYKGIDGAGSYKGVMIIVIEPKNRENGDLNERDFLTGKLSLFDCVGNTLTSSVNMEYDEENRRLIYIWQGKNSAGRKIGSGAYSLVAEVQREFYTKDMDGNRELIESGKVLKTTVGIAR